VAPAGPTTFQAIAASAVRQSAAEPTMRRFPFVVFLHAWTTFVSTAVTADVA
jgi:hypothetical protein